MKLHSDTGAIWLVLFFVLLYGCNTRQQVESVCYHAEGCSVLKHLD